MLLLGSKPAAAHAGGFITCEEIGMRRWTFTPVALALCTLGLASGAAHAQFKEPDKVKIGFITDQVAK